MINLFQSQPRPNADSVAQVKTWVRELFGLSEDVTIMVTELRCQEDDCPDVETIVAVLDEPGKARKHKLLKPVSEVTREDILGLAACGTHG